MGPRASISVAEGASPQTVGIAIAAAGGVVAFWSLRLGIVIAALGAIQWLLMTRTRWIFDRSAGTATRLTETGPRRVAEEASELEFRRPDARLTGSKKTERLYGDLRTALHRLRFAGESGCQSRRAVKKENVVPIVAGESLKAPGDVRRTAACIKACEGIPTELLERGFLLELIAACVHIREGRVREVLEELALERLRPVRRETADSPALRPDPRRRVFPDRA